jgi:hypothetical protein
MPWVHVPEVQSVPSRQGAPDPTFPHVTEHAPDAQSEGAEQAWPGASLHTPLFPVLVQMSPVEHQPPTPHPQLPREKHWGARPGGQGVQVAPFEPQPVFGSIPFAHVPFMQHPRWQ